eukprot:8209236-Karenia_brevis.AAC.1
MRIENLWKQGPCLPHSHQRVLEMHDTPYAHHRVHQQLDLEIVCSEKLKSAVANHFKGYMILEVLSTH